jgi:hypothetical protein
LYPTSLDFILVTGGKQSKTLWRDEERADTAFTVPTAWEEGSDAAYGTGD